MSTDGGKSWSGIYPIAIPGCHRPAVGYLSDGRIMLSYRSFVDNVKRVTAAVIFDESTAISISDGSDKIAMYQLDYDRNCNPDTGYTAWVELEGNKIITKPITKTSIT